MEITTYPAGGTFPGAATFPGTTVVDDPTEPDIDIAGEIAAIVAELTLAGIRAVDDPRDANPPCVLVNPPEIEFRFGKGAWGATWEAWCIVPDAGRHQALRALSLLVSQAQAALGYRAVSGRPDDTLMPDGSTLPMYVLTWTARIKP
jgi:hypothetical protein